MIKKEKVWHIVAFAILVFFEYFLAFLLACLVNSRFDKGFNLNGDLFFSLLTIVIFAIMLGATILIILFTYDKKFWHKNSLEALSDGEKKQILGNLEQARFQDESEIDKNFTKLEYSKLSEVDISGVPIKAVVKGNKYLINIAPSAHSMVIGSTGSGKTTSFINPTIQILSESKAKPSMLIADPKGELYALHAKSLEKKGYEVQVLDLRNPYNSSKWNPLERVYEKYQKMLYLEDYVVNLDKEDIAESIQEKDDVQVNEDKGGYTFYDVESLLKEEHISKKIKSNQSCNGKAFDNEHVNDLNLDSANVLGDDNGSNGVNTDGANVLGDDNGSKGVNTYGLNVLGDDNGSKGVNTYGLNVLGDDNSRNCVNTDGVIKVLKNPDRDIEEGFEEWQESEGRIESDFISIAADVSALQRNRIKADKLNKDFEDYAFNKDSNVDELNKDFDAAKFDTGCNVDELNKDCEGSIKRVSQESEFEIKKEDFGLGPWEFEGEIYHCIEELVNAIKSEKQKLFDEVYEDCNDLVSILCPVKNKKDPLWESGAKSFILAILLAMLEDSKDARLKMSKEKFNFYNLTKTALNTQNECRDLIKYFQGRSKLSKSTALSKQVLDSMDRTRGSYLSTIFDKLNLFGDLGICSLTSENEIEFEDMAEKSVALFLEIPDEKETRHTLAAMVILQAYKDLVATANAHKDLSLPKPVYFILDEFGNLPKINKLEQMVTVGRSRKLWLFLVLQSYAQLANVYDERIAEIIRSNCNIQIFIGTTDPKTLESFSKHCGNYSVATRNISYSSQNGDNLNSSVSVKERPLIYPSELSKLNNPKDMGNAIVTVFGYNPILSKYTPSFKVPMLNLEVSDLKETQMRFFNESAIYYDMKERNEYYEANKTKDLIKQHIKIEQDLRNQEINVANIIQQADRAVAELLNEYDREKLSEFISRKLLPKALELLERAIKTATSQGKDNLVIEIDRIRKYLELDLDKSVKGNSLDSGVC